METLLNRMDVLMRTHTAAKQQTQDPVPRPSAWFRERHRNLPPPHGGGISPIHPALDDAARRRRWIALCLRRAVDPDAMAEEVAARIVGAAWRTQDQALILTLDSGTQVVDRSDRVEVVGTADDLAIAALVACVKGRGWHTVMVWGSMGFRVAAARALLKVGINVHNPPPLPETEVPMLRAAGRRPVLQPPRDADRDTSQAARAPPRRLMRTANQSGQGCP